MCLIYIITHFLTMDQHMITNSFSIITTLVHIWDRTGIVPSSLSFVIMRRGGFKYIDQAWLNGPIVWLMFYHHHHHHHRHHHRHRKGKFWHIDRAGLNGLVVWFLLRVQEVPGSNPGWAPNFFLFSFIFQFSDILMTAITQNKHKKS